jgi:hypothetical protein
MQSFWIPICTHLWYARYGERVPCTRTIIIALFTRLFTMNACNLDLETLLAVTLHSRLGMMLLGPDLLLLLEEIHVEGGDQIGVQVVVVVLGVKDIDHTPRWTAACCTQSLTLGGKTSVARQGRLNMLEGRTQQTCRMDERIYILVSILMVIDRVVRMR